MSQRPDEDGLIARFFRPLARDAGALDFKDDAAVVAVDGPLVITKDMLVAGVHFFADDPPQAIARKALRVNLSDLAAKGARPRGFLLGLGLPADWSEDWLAAFAKGLDEDSRAFDVPLLGGDTVKAPVLTLSITALGALEGPRAPRRTEARPGDIIAVTGTIGEAALGLLARAAEREGSLWLPGLSHEDRAHLIRRYLIPEPRVGFAAALGRHAHAAMDVSDGLIGDLERLLRASGCAGRLDAAAVPLSRAVRAALLLDDTLMPRLLTGGDDYEILLTLAPADWPSMAAAAAAIGLPLTAIGTISAGEGLSVDNAPPGLPSRRAFGHF